MRARFRVKSIKREKGAYPNAAGFLVPHVMHTIELIAQDDMPSGHIEMVLADKEVASKIELDAEYFVEFTPAGHQPIEQVPAV
jgi:hypothetical protein